MTVAVDHPGAYELIAHDRHTAGVLELEGGAPERWKEAGGAA